ncbi:MAG: FecR domain-containing protein [Balneolales bacterium]
MNHNLLIRYLTDESADNEQYEVERWLEADPEHRKLLEELELIWRTSGMNLEAVENDFDAEVDWKALRYRIEIEVNREKKKMKPDKVGKEYRQSGFAKRADFAQFMRVAAVMLIAAFAGIFAWLNFHVVGSEEELVMREIVMDKGQRANLVLSDGTNVNLNADSKISMPEVFQQDKREVFLLEGEAYFEVAGDPDWPFLIHSGGAVIRVLGTSFAVRAYPEDEMVRVVVNEGTVSLASGHDKSIGANLTAGQLGLFHIKNDTVISKEVEDMEQFLSWIDGYLIFKETSMKEVALQQERRYNVEVDFGKPSIEELFLTATLKGRSVTNVLNVIAASLEIDYYQTDRQTIVFTDHDEKAPTEFDRH